MLYFKSFDEIQLSDISYLQKESITEDRFLDYKEEVPSQDSRGFLETITAFANSQGGVVVYGVKELRQKNEKTGQIEEICGFESDTIDTVKSRLESQIRDQIQPKIDYRMKELKINDRKYLLLVRVNEGWNKPYFFRFQKGLCFYRRAESQNIPMEHAEIKTSFLRSETIKEKLKVFREHRVQSIVEQKMPFMMEGDRIFIMHVLPLDSFKEDISLPQKSITQYISSVGPISGNGYTARPNLDGVFQYWSVRQNDHSKPSSYVQYFRNGVVEYGDTFVLESVSGKDRMHIKPFGDRISPAIRRAITYQTELGLNGPFYVTASLLNVKGTLLLQGKEEWDLDKSMKFDRDYIDLPIFEIEDPSANDFSLSRPILEMVCNAAGWEKCVRYDHDGKWC